MCVCVLAVSKKSVYERKAETEAEVRRLRNKVSGRRVVLSFMSLISVDVLLSRCSGNRWWVWGSVSCRDFKRAMWIDLWQYLESEKRVSDTQMKVEQVCVHFGWRSLHVW